MSEVAFDHEFLFSECFFFVEFGSCKFGWKEFGQFCYQFNFEQKTWQSARLQCQKQGGELTSINSPVEQAHISLEVGEFGLGKYAWIGMLVFLIIKRR
jgi:hypothetical protein